MHVARITEQLHGAFDQVERFLDVYASFEQTYQANEYSG